MERECKVYGHIEFGNISRISVAHLYNLRRSITYRNATRRSVKTKPSVSRIGEQAKPDPKGQLGYIRIDTVHQGDTEGVRGVYHINAVDEVTQWEIIVSVARISEAYLAPVLEALSRRRAARTDSMFAEPHRGYETPHSCLRGHTCREYGRWLAVTTVRMGGQSTSIEL